MGAAASSAATSSVAIAFGFPSGKKGIRQQLRLFGHLWSPIERFFVCAMRAGFFRLPRPATVMVPSKFVGLFREEEAFTWLEALLSGPRLRIRRVPWLQFCELYQCCINNSTPPAGLSLPRLYQLNVPPAYNLLPEKRQSLRTYLRRNLGLEAIEPDTVLFVKSERGSNQRRIFNETGVAASLKAFFAQARPELRFEHADLEALSHLEEIRLVARSAVFISLFGSALHWCRVLPPSALVVEIHGALKVDLGEPDLLLYSQLCANTMGLRWVGVPVPGAIPTVRRQNIDTSNPHQYAKWEHVRKSDVRVARVDPGALVATLRAALQGDWLPTFQAYASANSVGFREGSEPIIMKELRNLLQLPQYSAGGRDLEQQRR